MKTASQRNAATREEPVLFAPQESPVSKAGASADPRQVPRWGASGPAPAGTLHRLHAVDPEPPSNKKRLPDLDDDYIPRRGAQRFSLRALGRTRAGRITMSLGLTALVAGIAVAGFAVHHALFHDRRFLIATSADIDVTGNHHLTRADVLRVFSADVQHNIFNLPLAARRAELERLPWVEHATIIRLLPNRLRVDLRERTPIAFVRQGTQIGLVDATGVLLDMPALDAGDPHYSFPVLTGLAPTDPLSTRAARLQIYTDFLHQLDSSGKRLSSTISEVDVTDPEDLKALVASDDQSGSDILVHFGDQDFLHRYQQFQQHLPTWRQQYPRLASADMRYDAQVVLEMQPGSSTTPAADPALTAAATPTPPAAPKPASSVTVPPRPVIISHNTTSPAPIVADAPIKPGAPRLASETWASSPAPKPSVATIKPGTPSVPLHGTGGLTTQAASRKPATAKPTILRVSTPKPHSSSANEKLFAQLAADHKAALAKAAKSKPTRKPTGAAQ
jgi:cell division protein FtsQ